MAYAWHPAPPLPAAHASALAEAWASLNGRPDLVAVLLAGSVVRGTGGPTSDLDLFCLIDADLRQRRHLVAGSGVLVEMFLNPAYQILRYLDEERRENRPSAATMLVTGTVLLDRRPEVLASLRAAARDLLAAGPDPLVGAARERALYVVRDCYEDACDAEAAGTPALLPLVQCAVRAVSLHHALRRRWEPKTKNLAADLPAWDARAAALLAAFSGAPCLQTLRALLAHVLAEDGGLPIRSFDGPVEALRP